MSGRMIEPRRTAERNPPLFVTVCIRLSDFLSRIAPEARFEVEVQAGSTVANLISLLADRFSDDFRRALIDREKRLNGGIMLVLNGEIIAPRRIAGIAINHESDLSIIALTGGG